MIAGTPLRTDSTNTKENVSNLAGKTRISLSVTMTMDWSEKPHDLDDAFEYSHPSTFVLFHPILR